MEFNFENIIGKSKALREVLEMVKKVANTQATVLISGDSGTGRPEDIPLLVEHLVKKHNPELNRKRSARADRRVRSEPSCIYI